MNYSIWVTTKCNLGCKYCYEGKSKLMKSMKFDIAKDVIQYIEYDYFDQQSEEELVVNFHGGEPLLELDLVYFFINEIKRRCINNSVYFSLTTNATIMNDAVKDLIKNEQVDMTLSIDGMQNTHDKLRIYKDGSGSHGTIMKNAKQILSIYPDVRIRMTYDGNTVYDLEENIKYLIDKGFRVIVPIENQFDCNWDNGGIEALEKAIVNVKKYIAGTDVLVGICDPIAGGKQGNCRGGIAGKHIYVNGDIYPCMMVGGKEEFRIGNIYEGIEKNKVKNLLKYSECEHQECSQCQIKQTCDGNRCKIINKLVTGNYLSPSAVQCAVNSSIYKINGGLTM